MQAVKLRPEELLLDPVKSDWLLLCRVLPKGLPNPGDEPSTPQERKRIPLLNELHILWQSSRAHAEIIQSVSEIPMKSQWLRFKIPKGLYSSYYQPSHMRTGWTGSNGDGCYNSQNACEGIFFMRPIPTSDQAQGSF